MNKLGKYVKERRADMALTQIELAERIGITNITLSKIENGEIIGSNTIRKLSFFFNISTRDIRAMMMLSEDNS